MAKKNIDHVVFRFGPGTLECKHCGEMYTIDLPAPLNVWLASAKAFGKTHRNCKPKEEIRAWKRR